MRFITTELRLIGQKNAEIAKLIDQKRELLEALDVIANIATKPYHERALPAILDIARNSIKKAKGETP